MYLYNVSTLTDSNRNATGNARWATARRRTGRRRAEGTSTAASSPETMAARSVYPNGKLLVIISNVNLVVSRILINNLVYLTTGREEHLRRQRRQLRVLGREAVRTEESVKN